jgi:hypothetical protein
MHPNGAPASSLACAPRTASVSKENKQKYMSPVFPKKTPRTGVGRYFLGWVVAVVMYIARCLFAEAALGVGASTDTDTEWQCRDVLH